MKIQWLILVKYIYHVFSNRYLLPLSLIDFQNFGIFRIMIFHIKRLYVGYRSKNIGLMVVAPSIRQSPSDFMDLAKIVKRFLVVH